MLKGIWKTGSDRLMGDTSSSYVNICELRYLVL